MKRILAVLMAALIVCALAVPALAEDAEQVVETVAENTEQAAETIAEDAEQAVETVTEDTEQAVEAVTEKAEDTAEEIEEAAEEEKETWADTAFEDFRKAKWYVYVIIAVLAVAGLAGVAALGKKKAPRERMSTKIMAEGAMMIAIANVLSMIKVIQMPFGGSVTLFAMLPIVLMSFRHGTKWGLMIAFTHSQLQLILGLKNLSYCATLGAQIACVLLDYVVAYTVLGLASAFSRPIRSRTAGVCVGTAAVCFLRFVCHFFSGIYLWGSYKEYYDWAASLPTWLYSLIYNGNYMLLETVITVLGAVILVRGAAKLFDRQAAK